MRRFSGPATFQKDKKRSHKTLKPCNRSLQHFRHMPQEHADTHRHSRDGRGPSDPRLVLVRVDDKVRGRRRRTRLEVAHLDGARHRGQVREHIARLLAEPFELGRRSERGAELERDADAEERRDATGAEREREHVCRGCAGGEGALSVWQAAQRERREARSWSRETASCAARMFLYGGAR